MKKKRLYLAGVAIVILLIAPVNIYCNINKLQNKINNITIRFDNNNLTKNDVKFLNRLYKSMIFFGGPLPKSELLRQSNGYFKALNGVFDSTLAAQDLAGILGSKEGIFVPWTGENTDVSRKEIAAYLFNQINDRAIDYLDTTGNNLPINLAGHSHGGNVMVMVANMLDNEGSPVNIRNLLTLEAPVREYQLNDSLLKSGINHIQTYSPFDFVQNIGFMDVGKYGDYLSGNRSVTSRSPIGIKTPPLLNLPILMSGAFKHQFRNGVTQNINIAPLHNSTNWKTYRQTKTLYPEAGVYHHQSTRSIEFIEQILFGGN